MSDNILSTKFIFAVLVTIMGFVLVLYKMVEPNIWFNFVEVVGGTYVVGNVVSKFSPEAKT